MIDTDKYLLYVNTRVCSLKCHAQFRVCSFQIGIMEVFAMTTTQATEVIYDEFELAVLQVHLDFYRQLPEVSTLTCFSVVHRDECAEACRRLEQRGMMQVSQYDGKVIEESIEDDPSHPDYQKAICARHSRWTHPRSQKRMIRYVLETLLPGVNGTLSDSAPEEMVRLFKAGILKKNS